MHVFNKRTIILTAIFVLLIGIMAVFVVHEKISKIPQAYGEMTEDLQDSELYADFQSGKSVCFVGDSITEGTETYYLGWYEPLVPYIKGEVKNFSKGGWTTENLLDHKDELPEAEIYVVAIGINDVMRPHDGADSPEKYVENLGLFEEKIKEVSPDAKIYYIAPWIAAYSKGEVPGRRQAYADSLMKWCEGEERTGIDPYPVIREVLDSGRTSRYMRNNLHPNTRRGLGLYSYAVLKEA